MDARTIKVSFKPRICNLCGGRVELIDNSKVYGRSYGSGKMYRCTKCHAYVGTHKHRPDVALGILADKTMRKKKMVCHSVFDRFWKESSVPRKTRKKLYAKLANEMNISVRDCHFGFFNNKLLDEAYEILVRWDEEYHKGTFTVE